MVTEVQESQISSGYIRNLYFLDLANRTLKIRNSPTFPNLVGSFSISTSIISRGQIVDCFGLILDLKFLTRQIPDSTGKSEAQRIFQIWGWGAGVEISLKMLARMKN